MPGVLYARVLEIRTPETSGFMNKLIAAAQISSAPECQRQTVAGKVLLRCGATWKFQIGHHDTDYFVLTLERRRIFSRNDPLATCSLPLSWFPVDRVVRDWFPMIETGASPTPDGSSTTMVLLDIHLDSRRVPEFRASFAPLRVIVTWPRPCDEFTECTPPKQIFIVVNHPNETAMQQEYARPASAVYPPPLSLPSSAMYQSIPYVYPASGEGEVPNAPYLPESALGYPSISSLSYVPPGRPAEFL
jgi:hypothetical protein